MRRLALIGLLAAIMALPLAGAGSSAATALYNRANQLYQDGNYRAAAGKYREAVAAGGGAASLYYNLGNAELRSGRLGPAIAAYLRAQRLAPRDRDVKFNLEYARARIKARLPELPRSAIYRAFDRVVGFLNVNEWTLLVLAAYWLAAILTIVLILARGETARRVSRYLLYVCAATALVSLPFAATRVSRDHLTPRAVIMDEKAGARSGPGEDNAELFELYEGMDVTVGQCDSGWCRISAPGGFIGWVEARTFERL